MRSAAFPVAMKEVSPVKDNLEKANIAANARELWRFSDLKLLGFVDDRATLRRRIANDGFPQPLVLSANAIAWVAEEVREWIAGRPRGPAPQPARTRKAA
jgi:predicted DNA-binding transcriptional regulator AlpA